MDIAELSQDLGRRIRAQRIRLNLSQAEAAAHLGIALRTLQNWEAGTTFPWARHRRNLERFLKAESREDIP